MISTELLKNLQISPVLVSGSAANSWTALNTMNRNSSCHSFLSAYFTTLPSSQAKSLAVLFGMTSWTFWIVPLWTNMSYVSTNFLGVADLLGFARMNLR